MTIFVSTGTTPEGESLLVVGLDQESVARIVAGCPARVDGADHGLPGLVVIVMAETNQATMSAALVSYGVTDGWTMDTVATDSSTSIVPSADDGPVAGRA